MRGQSPILALLDRAGALQKIVNKLEVRAEIRTRIVSRHLNVGLLCHYFPETSFIFAVQ